MSWLFLDLRELQRSPFTMFVPLSTFPSLELLIETNRRCIWHLCLCVASLFFFVSILHISSDSLPQWLPTVIDCGVGTSLGLQNIPAAARNRVGEVLSGLIGSVFGGTQVIIWGDEEQHLQRNEALSSRRRPSDIETGSIV